MAHAGESGQESPPKPGKRAGRQALAFIFITVLLDMLALGMVAPVLPNLVRGFLHGDTSTTAALYGLFLTVFALMQFFFSPAISPSSTLWITIAARSSTFIK